MKINFNCVPQAYPKMFCTVVSELTNKVSAFVMRLFACIREYLCGCGLGDQSKSNVPGPKNLIPFYRGEENNCEGVTLDQILSWDDEALESVHNYIQWLFPLKSCSGSNSNAPVLNESTIATMKEDKGIQKNLEKAFNRMLTFYGLECQGQQIVRRSNFAERSVNFVTNDNHNFLRITRMISSLHLLGRSPEATAFFLVMHHISQNEGANVVSPDNVKYWKAAQASAQSL